jgi:hypothetical protein
MNPMFLVPKKPIFPGALSWIARNSCIRVCVCGGGGGSEQGWQIKDDSVGAPIAVFPRRCGSRHSLPGSLCLQGVLISPVAAELQSLTPPSLPEWEASTQAHDPRVWMLTPGIDKQEHAEHLKCCALVRAETHVMALNRREVEAVWFVCAYSFPWNSAVFSNVLKE